MPGLTKAEQAREIKRLNADFQALAGMSHAEFNALEDDAAKWRALEESFSVKHRVKPPYLVSIEEGKV